MDALHRPARRLLACLDLTSLGEADDHARIAALCASAVTAHGAPAAVCVYPEWIVSARANLDAHGLAAVAVASVANFPDGGHHADRVEREVTRAVSAGASEVDVVLPWRALLAGDTNSCVQVVRSARRAAGKALLKLILETGELGTPARIREASVLALGEGADFVKTSTGKVAVNATLGAAETMLEALHAHGGTAGFKAAGGIRSLGEAAAYLALADRTMGPGWATPASFRIGASTLLVELLGDLDGATA